MSFASFGAQVAAIMDVLAKAAVAEITKLMEDGTVVLRLEMRRKDGEIQDLRRSLDLLEAELRGAREAAAGRGPGPGQEQAAAGERGACRDGREVQQTCGVYLEPEADEARDVRPAVKDEPADEPADEPGDEPADQPADEPADRPGRGGSSDLCFEGAEPCEPTWPPAACGMFEGGSVSGQHHLQIFPSRADRNSEGPDDPSSAAAEQKAEDSLNAPIKMEVEIPPLCPSESALTGAFGRVSRPAFSPDRGSGPSAQRADAEDHLFLGRSNLRAKRAVNVWRSNQRLFPRLPQLEEHRAAHQAFKPYRCLECGKSFTQKTRLKTHQSVHTGERPFSCKICGKMFSRQDNCLRHERFHSGLKPYSCGQCGKSFTVLGNLKIHQEIHLQGR